MSKILRPIQLFFLGGGHLDKFCVGGIYANRPIMIYISRFFLVLYPHALLVYGSYSIPPEHGGIFLHALDCVLRPKTQHQIPAYILPIAREDM